MLACNALHIELSQIIRTDMLATALMLWSIDHALSIAGDSPGAAPGAIMSWPGSEQGWPVRPSGLPCWRSSMS
jgi:hypothetical protein